MTDSEIKQWIRDNEFPGRQTVSNALGITTRKARALCREVKAENQSESSNNLDLLKERSIPIEEFSKRFDIPLQIHESLMKLNGAVIADSDLRSYLGIASDKWKRAVDREEFTSYRLQVRGKWYWGKPEALKEVRRKIEVL